MPLWGYTKGQYFNFSEFPSSKKQLNELEIEVVSYGMIEVSILVQQPSFDIELHPDARKEQSFLPQGLLPVTWWKLKVYIMDYNTQLPRRY